MCLSHAEQKNAVLTRAAHANKAHGQRVSGRTRDVGRYQRWPVPLLRRALTWTQRGTYITQTAPNTGAALAQGCARSLLTLVPRTRQRATSLPHARRRHARSAAACDALVDALEDAADVDVVELGDRRAALRACSVGNRPVGTCHAHEGRQPLRK